MRKRREEERKAQKRRMTSDQRMDDVIVVTVGGGGVVPVIKAPRLGRASWVPSAWPGQGIISGYQGLGGQG
jgi:hypothetical protein